MFKIDVESFLAVLEEMTDQNFMKVIQSSYRRKKFFKIVEQEEKTTLSKGEIIAHIRTVFEEVKDYYNGDRYLEQLERGVEALLKVYVAKKGILRRILGLKGRDENTLFQLLAEIQGFRKGEREEVEEKKEQQDFLVIKRKGIRIKSPYRGVSFKKRKKCLLIDKRKKDTAITPAAQASSKGKIEPLFKDPVEKKREKISLDVVV